MGSQRVGHDWVTPTSLSFQKTNSPHPLVPAHSPARTYTPRVCLVCLSLSFPSSTFPFLLRTHAHTRARTCTHTHSCYLSEPLCSWTVSADRQGGHPQEPRAPLETDFCGVSSWATAASDVPALGCPLGRCHMGVLFLLLESELVGGLGAIRLKLLWAQWHSCRSVSLKEMFQGKGWPSGETRNFLPCRCAVVQRLPSNSHPATRRAPTGRTRESSHERYGFRLAFRSSYNTP